MIRKSLLGALAAVSLLGSMAAAPAVACPGDGMNARSDRFVSFFGQSLSIGFADLLDNDICEGPCRGKLRFLGAFENRRTAGEVEIRDGQIVFTPNAGFSGETKFNYLITDATGRILSTDVVRIRVRPSVS